MLKTIIIFCVSRCCPAVLPVRPPSSQILGIPFLLLDQGNFEPVRSDVFKKQTCECCRISGKIFTGSYTLPGSEGHLCWLLSSPCHYSVMTWCSLCSLLVKLKCTVTECRHMQKPLGNVISYHQIFLTDYLLCGYNFYDPKFGTTNDWSESCIFFF